MVAIISLIIAILTILFGVLVLIFPKFLRYAVGIYFILVGAVALLKILGLAFLSALI